MARFVVDPRSGKAEVSVLIVTYNNAEDIEGLLASLRAQAAQVAIRVICADNSSSDDTVALLRGHGDVTLVITGGNLGYAGGINAARALVPPGEHILVLNPDLRLDDAAIRALLGRLDAAGAGVVAPRILGTDQRLARSLRREPSISRALGDAFWGSRFGSRPGWLSDEIAAPAAYQQARQIDWASGAALLVHRDAAAAVGAWDERFFLYSEETDFQRRVRAAGYEVWFEPSATVVHRMGGSGSSKQLLALMEVNRVRYFRKHHRRAPAAAYHAVVVLHQILRCWKPERRYALRMVAGARIWAELPHASRD